MSAYVLDRKAFITIAAFVAQHGSSGPIGDHWLHVYHPDVKSKRDQYLSAEEVASHLIMGNLQSVAYRYDAPVGAPYAVTNKDYRPVANKTVLQAVDLFGILRSLQYQSCEVKDYEKTAAYAVLISLLWLTASVAAEQAGASTWD